MTNSYYISGPYDLSVKRMMTKHKPDFVEVKTLEESSVVIFTGGADILPHWYDEKGIPGCYYYPDRDDIEVADFFNMRTDQQAWGICRGAQLLWALSGGKLWQDVSDHAGTPHSVTDEDTQTPRVVNSVHHQQLMPVSVSGAAAGAAVTKAKILAATHRARSKVGRVNGEKIIWTRDSEIRDHKSLDIEAVIIPKTETSPFIYGFQAHPEYGMEPCTNYFFELIERYG